MKKLTSSNLQLLPSKASSNQKSFHLQKVRPTKALQILGLKLILRDQNLQSLCYQAEFRSVIQNRELKHRFKRFLIKNSHKSKVVLLSKRHLKSHATIILSIQLQINLKLNSKESHLIK